MTRMQMQNFIDSVVVLRDNVSDKEASAAVSLYPKLHGDGRLIPHGTRLNIGGKLMRAAVDLYDTAENTPDKAPTLWEEIDYINGVRKIPETITTGLKFSKGEQGLWKGKVYESLLDNNVWTPDAYPQGWIEANG